MTATAIRLTKLLCSWRINLGFGQKSSMVNAQADEMIKPTAGCATARCAGGNYRRSEWDRQGAAADTHIELKKTTQVSITYLAVLTGKDLTAVLFITSNIFKADKVA